VDEARQWREWARAARREDDLRVVDAAGAWRYDFLQAEATRGNDGGGLTINIVALLDELAQAIAGDVGKGESGDAKFFEGALHHMNTNLVDLALLAEVGVSLPVLRSLLLSAPQTPLEADSKEWQARSDCYLAVMAADQNTASANADTRADFDECKNYWLKEYPALSERTRSIITLMFSMLARPFLTRPLRRLFATDTNLRPEDAFDGKIIIVNVPCQTYDLVGKCANLVWKLCFEKAALRRAQPVDGGYLRPVFLWCEEMEMFISPFDFLFASVCRSASACMFVIVQNRESLVSVLKNEAMIDSLCCNLGTHFYCANVGTTNEWASRLIGEQWVRVQAVNANRPAGLEAAGTSAGVSFHDERRRYCEEAVFTQLRRGGELNNLQVDAIVHGPLFDGEPYRLITFDQR
jgi:hypothetical protein